MSERYVVEASTEEGIRLPIHPEQIEAAVRYALEAHDVPAAELSIALVSDDTIAELNQQFLGHAGPTDVISFALHQEGERPLGDVYIGVEQARRQAAELGVSGDEELLRLALHGLLHVLGYDHPEGEEREDTKMYRRQEELLSAFIDRTGPSGR